MKTRVKLALAILSFAVFVTLAVIAKLGTFGSADLQAARWINALDFGGLINAVFVWASEFGREYFWIPVVGVMFVFGDTRTRLLAIALSTLFLVGIVAGELSKAIVMRERPFVHPPVMLLAPLDTDFSYPSGHALIVSIGAVFALTTFRRKWVAGLLTLEAAVVCFSRVYVGAHYPTDVIGGIALGAAIVFAGLYIERTFLHGYTHRLRGYLERKIGRGRLSL